MWHLVQRRLIALVVPLHDPPLVLIGSLPRALRHDEQAMRVVERSATLVQWIDPDAPIPGFDRLLLSPRSFVEPPTSGIRKAQLPGPGSVPGPPVAQWREALAHLVELLPSLHEVWLDEPVLTPHGRERLDGLLSGWPAHVRIGLHSCAAPGDLDRWLGHELPALSSIHLDASSDEAGALALAFRLPASIEVVPGLIDTREPRTHAVPNAAERARLDAWLACRPIRRIAPACGLGLHDAASAACILATLDQLADGFSVRRSRATVSG